MKKKLTAIVLAACMMPITSSCVWADDDAWKDNTGTIDLDNLTADADGAAFDGTTVVITKGGDYTVTGTLADGMIYVYSDEKVKIRLSGASITNSSGPAIYFAESEKSFITLSDGTENYLEDGAEYTAELSAEAKGTVFSESDLEIKGGGSLTIASNYGHAICSDDDISIEEGTITVTSAVKDGLHANDKVEILGGTLTISVTDDGIQTENDVITIDGGDITINTETGKGITGYGNITVNGGTIDITAGSEGIESKSDMIINDGDISITAKDDGLNTGGGSGQMGGGMGGGSMGGSGMMQAPSDDGQMQIPADGGMTMEAPDGSSVSPMNENGMGGGGRGNGGMGGGSMGGGGMMQAPSDGNTEMATPDPNSTFAPMDETVMGGGMGGAMRENDDTDDEDDTRDSGTHELYINGGTIYISAQGDGIDSNGDIYIAGGTITVDGPTNGGDGALDAGDGGYGIYVSGGTLIAAGAVGMVENPSNDSEQPSVSISFSSTIAAGSQIQIVDSNGSTLMDYTPSKTVQSVIFSSPDLASGESYTVYVDGSEEESFTIDGGLTSVGSASSGGMGGGSMGGGGRGNGGGMGGGHNQANADTMSFDPNGGNDSGIKVKLNGKEISFDQSPQIIDSRTMVPLRAIFEALGMTVDWDEQTYTVTAVSADCTIVIVVGSNTATVNGQSYELDAAATIVGGSTLVPVRFIAESLGMTVDWDEDSQTVSITSGVAAL